MEHTVEIVDVPPKPLAAVRRHTSRGELPDCIRGGLGLVYTFLKEARERGEPVESLGLGVAVYLADWNVELGVRVSGEVEPCGEIVPSATPAGRAATIAHFGAYERIPEAGDAMHKWCEEHGEKVIGPYWEEYGHWHEDQAQCRTDLFVLLAGD